MQGTQGGGDAQKQIQEAKQQRAWFIDMVRSQERLAHQNPGAYKRRVWMLGMLGYAYIFGMLAIALGFIALLVWVMVSAGSGHTVEVRLILIAGLVAIAIIRSLFVKIEAPNALTISRAEAPILYREVDAIADRLGAPRPDEIRVNEELNAAAAQVPRLGVFGWYRNILLLGMPLLLSLTPDEARSVIAHEFGHFSGAHGKFGAWAYRINRTWEQLRYNLSRQGRGAWLFSGFFNWFQPRFAATTFVIRRANEYEADRAAASVAGAKDTARALMKLPFLGEHLNQSFWEPFYDRAKESSAPPNNAFQKLPEAARSTTDADTVARHLGTALKEQTDYDDTHPSLTDRLRSLGELPAGDLRPVIDELSRPIEQSAADWFFGNRLPEFLQRVEQHYLSEIRENWRRAFARFDEYRTKLAELETVAQQKPLTEEEEVDRAYFNLRLHGAEVAEPLLRAALAKYPDNATAEFLLGDVLLDRDDAAGLEHVERARALDAAFGEAAIKVAAAFHYRRGEMDRLEALKEEAVEHHYRSEIAEQEARRVTPKDRFEPHGLSLEEVRAVREQLAALPGAERAYMVRKTISATGESRCYLVVFPKKKLLESGNEAAEITRAIVQSVTLPEGTMVYSTRDKGAWSKALDAVPGSRIYDAKDKMGS